MTQNKTASASRNLDKRTTKVISINLVIIAICTLVSIILLILANQKLTDYKSISQEILAIKKSNKDTVSLRNFANEKINDINQLDQFFPNEQNIIEVIQELENLVFEYDENGDVKFSEIRPSKTNNGLAILLSIKLNINSIEVVNFLRKLEKLPYIFSNTIS